MTGPIDTAALDSLSVAPDAAPTQDAGQDEALARRLKKDPENHDAKLDVALDESMDASDPPSNTQPGRND
jgi:hypothetical protein